MSYNQYLLIVMFIQTLFPAILLMIMAYKRVTSVSKRTVHIKYFRTFSDKSEVPEFLLILERHYSNLFEMPLLFLICCLTYLQFDSVDYVSLVLSWSFVFVRLIHSVIHLTSNNVLHRMLVFGLSCFFLLFMWFYLVLKVCL